MKYMLLIYEDPQVWAAMPEEEQNQIMKEYYAYTQWLQDEGMFRAGDPLQPVSTATTVRVRGFDGAEEAVQDAFAVAVERWPRDGLPNNPGAWIVRTARNKAIDRLRRERRLAQKRVQLEHDAERDRGAVDEELSAIPDER